MIISGFPGTGKTVLARKYRNVIDLESIPYLYCLTHEQKKMKEEEQKGIKKAKNPKWPQNYIQEIIEKDKEYDIVLISQYPEVLRRLGKITNPVLYLLS